MFIKGTYVRPLYDHFVGSELWMGEKYVSVSRCHAGHQCVVYCGKRCFWMEQRAPPPFPALLHLHWMRESLPFSPSQIVQTEDISDSTQFITFLPAFQTNTHTQNEYCQPVTAQKKKKNLKILYMQLI